MNMLQMAINLGCGIIGIAALAVAVEFGMIVFRFRRHMEEVERQLKRIAGDREKQPQPDSANKTVRDLVNPWLHS